MAAPEHPLVEDLRSVLAPGRLVLNDDVFGGYLHDEAEWAAYGAPVAVVRARSTADVQAVVLACVRHGVPLVTRGAGTGLSGGANAVEGCVVLSTEQMTGILELNAVERLAVVEPGVVNDDLRAACAAEGLWYPPTPPARPGRRSAATWPPTPAGCAA